MMLDKEAGRRLPPCSGFICGPFNDDSNAIKVMGCVALSVEDTAGRPSKANFLHNSISGCSNTPMRHWSNCKIADTARPFHGTVESLETAVHEISTELQQHPETALSLAYKTNTNLFKTSLGAIVNSCGNGFARMRPVFLTPSANRTVRITSSISVLSAQSSLSFGVRKVSSHNCSDSQYPSAMSSNSFSPSPIVPIRTRMHCLRSASSFRRTLKQFSS